MKGIAALWLQILFSIGIFGILYIIMSQVIFGNITPALYPQFQLINDTESMVNKTAMFASINFLTLIWEVLPFIFILGMLLYAMLASQRKGYQVSYGG